MPWDQAMTSAHAALARAEWAFEAGDEAATVREIGTATHRAMEAWLQAHRRPISEQDGLPAVIPEFGTCARSRPSRAVLRLHFWARNRNSAWRGEPDAPRSSQEGALSPPPTADELRALLEAVHGAVQSLEAELKGGK